ncbi:ribose 5-phosphate isomerase B [Fulvivirga sedimenti]|uniref:Ribose 5-phosphate isomerase B n=1 Tax=Fulvivirga sedimenti TaxID=2879465 RepID=A0A9X1KW71_9BACT|nr:ribose 5-phosphate isomerase B [Fulvivirga sedimenti]MCA6074435.1 ribose 5-phosphate isomerase B [Fulvivirga sedimenti]
MMTLAIGGDHAGYEFKSAIIEYLNEKGIQTKDFGTYSADSTDYPDFAHPVSLAVQNKEFPLGILICGSGNGVCMTANKHQGIRAALCWNVELSELARKHNNANILCLPARFISIHLARKIVDAFLATNFEGGRHERRVSKIGC